MSRPLSPTTLADLSTLRLPPGRCWLDAGALRAESIEPGAIAPAFDVTATDAALVKRDRRTAVWRTAAAGRSWIVKQYFLAPWRTALYHAVRLSPAWREWRASLRLHQIGQRVCVPVGLLHDVRGGQMLLLPHVQGPTVHQHIQGLRSLDDLTDEQRAARRTLIDAVGRQVGALLAAGWVNRDYKPGNLIMDHACARDGQSPVMIDTVGLRRRTSDSQAIRMLAVLMRSAARVSYVSPRERLECLRTILRTDPSLARGHSNRARHVVHQVRAAVRRKPD